MQISDVEHRGRDTQLAATANQIADNVIGFDPVTPLDIAPHRSGYIRVGVGQRRACA
jgi:hypothetical protein